MRTFLVLAALATVSACGAASDGARAFDGRPLDGFFVVTPEVLSNTCGNTYDDAEGSMLVEFYLRDDGLYDIRHGSNVIPGPKLIEEVERDGGNIDYHVDHATSIDVDYRLTGTATPDGIDVELAYKGYTRCTTRLDLNGPLWPVADTNAVPGHYSTTRTTLGNTCDGANRQTGRPTNTLLTVTEGSGGLTISSSENWTIEDVVPDASGDVDWYGVLRTEMGSWSPTRAAKLRGRIAPDDLRLVLSYWEYGTTPDTTLCADESSLVGAKRVPRTDAVDNDYRGNFSSEDGCYPYASPAQDVRSQARLITQPDGTVELIDPFVDMSVEIADGKLYGRTGSPPEGIMVTVEGTLAPPLLSYTITYDRFVSGLWDCSSTVTVTDAHVRYVFE